MFPRFLHIFAILGLLLAAPALAAERSIIATVNDTPITDLDVKSRINIWKVLGRKVDGGGVRKQALESIIDDYAAIETTKKSKVQPSSDEVNRRLGQISKGLQTDMKGLSNKLKAQGTTLDALKLQVSGQIATSRLIFGKYQEKVDVKPEEVDAKMAEIKADIDRRLAQLKKQISSDPRMQGITVYDLLEISFPIDKDSLSDSLLSSRFVEAQQVARKMNGCSSAKDAASGIFNVKVGKVQQADGAKIPPAMRAELEKNGQGKAVGPFRSPEGIQLWVFCKKEKIKPEMPDLPNVQYPTREQVEGFLSNEKFVSLEKKYTHRFRDAVLVEYRDPAYQN